MISTDITSTIDRPVDRSAARVTSGALAVCRAASTTRVMAPMTAPAAYQESVDHQATAALVLGGQVWVRPAVLDVFATTPGHLARRPPT